MAMRMWMGLLSVSVGLTGCLDAMGGAPDARDTADTGGAPDGPGGADGSGDPDEPDRDEPDPDEPDPDDPDPDEPDPDDVSPGDPDGDPLESRAWCLPYAKGATSNVVLSPVPTEVFDAVCPLETEIQTQSWTSADAVTRYVWQGDVLWVTRPGSSFSLQEMTFDDAGRLVRTRIGSQRNNALAFAPWDDVYRVELDGRGGVIELATQRGAIEHVYLRQTWRDGRLVARSEERNRYDADSGELTRGPLETTRRSPS